MVNIDRERNDLFLPILIALFERQHGSVYLKADVRLCRGWVRVTGRSPAVQLPTINYFCLGAACVCKTLIMDALSG